MNVYSKPETTSAADLMTQIEERRAALEEEIAMHAQRRDTANEAIKKARAELAALPRAPIKRKGKAST